jgi:chaperone required for assembly of F1-ATPase
MLLSVLGLSKRENKQKKKKNTCIDCAQHSKGIRQPWLISCSKMMVKERLLDFGSSTVSLLYSPTSRDDLQMSSTQNSVLNHCFIAIRLC